MFDEGKANSDNSVAEERQYPANAWGLRSVSGNAYEWCEDWLGEYGAELTIDPSGTNLGKRRVLRGGGWGHSQSYSRSASRGGYPPDYRYPFVSLRLAGGFSSKSAILGCVDRWEWSESEKPARTN